MTLIAFISTFLLTAWFFYACRLILQGGQSRNCLEPLEDFGAESYAEPTDEDRLHQNYETASYLLQNASELRPEGLDSVEHWMIHIYYLVVRGSFLVARGKLAPLSLWLRKELELIVEWVEGAVGGDDASPMLN